MPILSRRDLAAAILIAVLLAIYVLFLASSNLVSGRQAACATLIVSGTVIILCPDDGRPDAISWLVAFLAVAAVASATLSIAGPRPTLLLTISIATTLTLWCIHLAEHITFTSPDRDVVPKP